MDMPLASSMFPFGWTPLFGPFASPKGLVAKPLPCLFRALFPVAHPAGSRHLTHAALIYSTHPSAPLLFLKIKEGDQGGKESVQSRANPAVFWIFCLLKKYFSLF